MFFKSMRKSLRGHQADPGAHALHGCHQRKSKGRHPEQPETETRTGLGISGDTGRIVITGAGDKPGPNIFRNFREPSFFLHKKISVPQRETDDFKIQFFT